MDYKEIVFTISQGEAFHQDLLIAGLGEIGYDTFEEIAQGFKAYIREDLFRAGELEQLASEFEQPGLVFSYEINTIPQKNWNEEWERNFEPLIIEDTCYVRATFHPPHPEYPHEIVIDPKMAFGTGHHATTSLMIGYLLEERTFEGRSVLDMGCGTGILAILAAQMGAAEIVAIDFDPVCYESTLENAQLNHVPQIKAICGSKEVIPDQQFDTIAANINRNILLDQLARYFEVLKPGGTLYLSGFYQEPDLDILIERAKQLSFQYFSFKKSGDWVAAKFVRVAM